VSLWAGRQESCRILTKLKGIGILVGKLSKLLQSITCYLLLAGKVMSLTEQDREALLNVLRALNDASSALAYATGRLLQLVDRSESGTESESDKGKGKGKGKGKRSTKGKGDKGKGKGDDDGKGKGKRDGSRSPRRGQVIGARTDSLIGAFLARHDDP
jgi:hypothetical protein